MSFLALPILTLTKLKNRENLLIRDCDEGALVFDATRGITNVLNHRGVQALHSLSDTRSTEIEALRVALKMVAEADLPQFQALISSLEDAGLIYRC